MSNIPNTLRPNRLNCCILKTVDTLKVPKQQFDAALAALLKGKPLPMAEIGPKKKAKRQAKKS
jgi:hypothetical protein